MSLHPARVRQLTLTYRISVAGPVCAGHQARASEAPSRVQTDLSSGAVQAQAEHHRLWQTPPRAVLGSGFRTRDEEREHAPRHCRRQGCNGRLPLRLLSPGSPTPFNFSSTCVLTTAYPRRTMACRGMSRRRTTSSSTTRTSSMRTRSSRARTRPATCTRGPRRPSVSSPLHTMPTSRASEAAST